MTGPREARREKHYDSEEPAGERGGADRDDKYHPDEKAEQQQLADANQSEGKAQHRSPAQDD